MNKILTGGLEAFFLVLENEPCTTWPATVTAATRKATSHRPARVREGPPAVVPNAGDEVIVMGYPTGMRAVMARAGERFASALSASGPLDFWQVARKLAKGGYLTPLATRGIVGQRRWCMAPS